MSDNEKSFSRRAFIGVAGVTGAFLGANLLSPSTAKAISSNKSLPKVRPNETKINDTAPAYPPRQKPKPGEKIHEFEIDVSIQMHEILPGVQIHAFTYNKTLPGPEIRVTENDWISVNLTNHTSEFHTIHWHGMYAPNEMDGVPLGTQWPVGPGQKFNYLFRAQPAGTHFYHCHNMTPLHVQAGMYGALIIEPKEDIVKKVYSYEREYTLLLSEIDTNMIREQMNDMLMMMNKMEKMNSSERLMKQMNGRMMGWFKDKDAFVKAFNSGYIPPYVSSMAGPLKAPNYNYFLINGKSYPMTEALQIKTGENIRIRLIGAGAMPHFIHLHGHDFWHVCQDGAPLSNPVRMNTIPIFPGTTSDIIVQGTNPGHWHFHDHSDLSTTNNGFFPGGMMTMLMYDDADKAGVKVPEIVQVNS